MTAKRFVESNEQLLNVVIESLYRLQAELHGELAAVGDLWNNQEKEWWPKQEEDISDYIARFLRKDLSERGVVVNREVQIRRGRRGEMPVKTRTFMWMLCCRIRPTESHYGR